MQVSVDNTFDRVDWEPLPHMFLQAAWLQGLRSRASFPDWYNRKAHSTAEAAQIQGIMISEKAMKRISGQVKEYFD